MPKSAAITGFHLDSDGVWVAELACGHQQHVRHRPPLHDRSWVSTVEGRAAGLGQPLPCPLCDMPQLPAGLVCYRSTATFDEKTVPAALLRAHQLRAGTWGRVVVEVGRLLYVLEEAVGAAGALGELGEGALEEQRAPHSPSDGEAPPGEALPSFVLTAHFAGVVPPQMPHHVELRGPVRFRIDFYRQPAGVEAR